MLEAEQPEERNREVARRPPLLQCIEVGSPASPGSRNLDAKPKRSCLSTQHGGAVDGGGERVWGVLGVQGGGGLGAGGGGQRISKPLRGLVFKNQVSEEFCCQIVVVLSLFCLILDLIQHHFHLLWCGLKFYQL